MPLKKLRQKTSNMLRFMSFWPPLAGAGIKIEHMSDDMREVDVQLGLYFWNRNYVGTQFGGSLYAMTDPFYMLMLMHNLGRDYIVWDKAASIRFKKPGRKAVKASFRLSEDQIQKIKTDLETERKVEPIFEVQVIDVDGLVVAEVSKTLYVTKKAPKPA